MAYDTTMAPPLSEAVLLILMSLTQRPRHGYAILTDVEKLSEGRVQLSTGTLYGALQRLLHDRWIEKFAEDEAPRGRQAYRLTVAGRKALQAEIVRMKHLTRLANLRLSKDEV